MSYIKIIVFYFVKQTIIECGKISIILILNVLNISIILLQWCKRMLVIVMECPKVYKARPI